MSRKVVALSVSDYKYRYNYLKRIRSELRKGETFLVYVDNVMYVVLVKEGKVIEDNSIYPPMEYSIDAWLKEV